MKFTKLYEGIIGLAKVTAGEECDHQDYMEIKNDFHYPGELLDKMEKYGYTSVFDYISVMAGLRIVRKYENDLTFVGNQLEEFLNRARKKSLKEKSIMLLFQTLSFTNDKTVKELSNDEISIVIGLSKKVPLEESFEFLEELMNENSCYMDAQPDDLKLILSKTILEYRMSVLPKLDVIEKKEVFINAIVSMSRICRNLFYDENKIRNLYGEDLGKKIFAFNDVYEEPIKKTYEKTLVKMGFSNMDILNLNLGIWYLSRTQSFLFISSPIKWWRLKRKWFQALFLQEKEISFPDDIRRLLDEKMPHKIDGETTPQEFLLKSFSGNIINSQNSDLMFNFLTEMKQNEVSESLKKIRMSLLIKMDSLSVDESLKIYAESLPSVSYYPEEAYEALRIFETRFYPRKRLSADKRTLCKILKFLVECYEHNFMANDTLIAYTQLLATSNNNS